MDRHSEEENPRLTRKFGDGPVAGPGSPLISAMRLAEAAARGDCPVFLRGESGCGKEVLARHLHRRSRRAGGPLVAVNCAALPPNLIESELFGHRKGAFTGASADSPGKFRLAQGGTLFLDEIGDMPLEVQTRLLRVLEEKTVSPLGDSREHRVDFRLVCATHRNLAREVREGRFREDLYYRINVLEIRIPPLRERPMDILPLLRRFLAAHLSTAESEAALAALPASILEHGFPGNVRELRNLAERYCVLREMGHGWVEAFRAGAEAAGAVSEMLPVRGRRASPAAADGRGGIRDSRHTDAEILHALGACGNHRARASGLLGLTRRALQYRLAKMKRANPI